MKYYIATALVIFPCLSGAGEVCLGNNLSKVAEEHTHLLQVQVDDLPPAYFARPYLGPTKIANDLNETITHSIKVYFNGKVVKSWLLDFNSFATGSVLIWRSAGSWRMDSNEAGKCN
jgi:hypothetical protein